MSTVHVPAAHRGRYKVLHGCTLASLKRDWEVLQVLLPWTGLGLRGPSSFCLLLQANESGDELLEQGIKTLVRKLADRETAASPVREPASMRQNVGAFIYSRGRGLLWQ